MPNNHNNGTMVPHSDRILHRWRRLRRSRSRCHRHRHRHINQPKEHLHHCSLHCCWTSLVFCMIFFVIVFGWAGFCLSCFPFKLFSFILLSWNLFPSFYFADLFLSFSSNWPFKGVPVKTRECCVVTRLLIFRTFWGIGLNSAKIPVEVLAIAPLSFVTFGISFTEDISAGAVSWLVVKFLESSIMGSDIINSSSSNMRGYFESFDSFVDWSYSHICFIKNESQNIMRNFFKWFAFRVKVTLFVIRCL